jgi:hypothetical protein
MSSKYYSLCFAVVLVALVVAAGFSNVRALSVFDITYPIADLGGCADRIACKAYCSDSANQVVCKAFADEHALVVQIQTHTAGTAQQEQSGKLKAIQKDGGPGACATGASDPLKACQAYCSDTAHIQECVAYGNTHKLLTGDQLKQAQKVAAALKRGAQLPQGCTDTASCTLSCLHPSSLDQAKSCYDFAKSAGLLPKGFDDSIAKKIFSSNMPTMHGTSTSMGTSTTLMNGPGGCTSKDECQTYCVDHQDECIKFAQRTLAMPNHRPDMTSTSTSAADAPGFIRGVRDCIIAVIGQDAFDKLSKDTTSATADIKNAIRACTDQLKGIPGMMGSTSPTRGPGMASSSDRGMRMDGEHATKGGGPMGQQNQDGRPMQKPLPTSPTSFIGLLQQMAAATISFGSQF